MPRDVLIRMAFEKLDADKREILFLVDIIGLKYAEAADVIGILPGTVMSRVSRAGQAAAMAASVAALFAVLAMAQKGSPDPVPGPLDRHHSFAGQAYAVQQTDNVTPVAQWMGRDFDLTSAKLTLVDVAMPENGDMQLHFSGVNGCRLTVGIYADPPVLPAAASGIAIRSWSAGAFHYSMLAEGMDPGKFSAIHRLLVTRTQDHRRDTATRMAVRAVPCA